MSVELVEVVHFHAWAFWEGHSRLLYLSWACVVWHATRPFHKKFACLSTKRIVMDWFRFGTWWQTVEWLRNGWHLQRRYGSADWVHIHRINSQGMTIAWARNISTQIMRTKYCVYTSEIIMWTTLKCWCWCAIALSLWGRQQYSIKNVTVFKLEELSSSEFATWTHWSSWTAPKFKCSRQLSTNTPVSASLLLHHIYVLFQCDRARGTSTTSQKRSVSHLRVHSLLN